jgi:hypothetical protein
VVDQHAVAGHVQEHALGAVGGDIGETVVVVLLLLVTEVAEGVEEEAGEQAHPDPQLQHEQLRRQRPCPLGGGEGGEEDLGGAVGKGAVVVDDEGDGVGVGQEGFIAALPQILLPQPPLQALRQRHEVLHHLPAGLRAGQDLGGGRAALRRRGGDDACSAGAGGRTHGGLRVGCQRYVRKVHARSGAGTAVV